MTNAVHVDTRVPDWIAQLPAEIRRYGKHFVDRERLIELDRVRSALQACEPSEDQQRAVALLDVVLDKFDDAYDYRSYLALRLFPLAELRDDDLATRVLRRNRLILLLLTDLMQFELATIAGETCVLPELTVTPALVAKRCRLAQRVLGHALAGAGLGVDPGPDNLDVARRLCASTDQWSSAAERRLLDQTMLPVYISHDEYMFLRVLQCFEVTFATLVPCLEETLDILRTQRLDLLPRAAERVQVARQVLAGSAPLFSLLATMRRESFATFRVYTEGASAIQSRAYKQIERLCRLPATERLEGAAFDNVPEVQAVARQQTSSIDEAFQELLATAPDTAGLEGFRKEMAELARVLRLWRNTHYQLAVRLLGASSGTGSTEGTPYLERARHDEVFPGLEGLLDDEPEDAPSDLGTDRPAGRRREGRKPVTNR